MIKDILKKLDVDVHYDIDLDINSYALPSKIKTLLSIYNETILFSKNVYSKFNDKDQLPVDMLWGIEKSEQNISIQNQNLNNIAPDFSDLYSFGGTLSGDHVCISLTDECIYYFRHDDIEPITKISNNIDEFFETLVSYDDDPIDDDGVIDCQFDF